MMMMMHHKEMNEEIHNFVVEPCSASQSVHRLSLCHDDVVVMHVVHVVHVVMHEVMHEVAIHVGC